MSVIDYIHTLWYMLLNFPLILETLLFHYVLISNA